MKMKMRTSHLLLLCLTFLTIYCEGIIEYYTQTVNSSQGLLSCKTGHYNYTIGNRGCLPCPRGTYCDSQCTDSCKPCPPGRTTYSEGQKCSVNYVPGWSYAGCRKASGKLWNATSYANTSITTCHALAAELGYAYFAMKASVCSLLLEGFTSTGISASCSTPCDHTDYSEARCGGAVSYSLYNVIPSEFVGFYSESEVTLVLLETIPSGFPSIADCYSLASLSGYEYFFVKGGTQCYGTNNASVGGLARTNMTLQISLCSNGDPCGSSNASVGYMVTELPPPSLPSADTSTSSTSTSTTPCFEDGNCKVVIIIVFSVAGVIGLLCLFGVVVALAAEWRPVDGSANALRTPSEDDNTADYIAVDI